MKKGCAAIRAVTCRVRVRVARRGPAGRDCACAAARTPGWGTAALTVPARQAVQGAGAGLGVWGLEGARALVLWWGLWGGLWDGACDGGGGEARAGAESQRPGATAESQPALEASRGTLAAVPAREVPEDKVEP